MESKPDNNEPLPEGPEEAALTEDLVAYLDGELDATTNEAVENRIGVDATIRAEADALKKTWDLLDYLPRPDPSPNFTERTLSRIEPIPQSGANSTPSRSALSAAPQRTSLTLSDTPASSPRKRVLIACVGALLVAAAGIAGYFGRAQVVEHFDRIDQQGRRLEEQDRVAKDRRLLQNYPLYRIVDDMEFVRHLDDPELFGDDPGSTAGLPGALSRPRDSGGTSGEDNDVLLRRLRSFQALPEARQEQIRAIDREFHELDEESQSRYRLVMERYAFWLTHLADEDRRRIEGARPGRRIVEIEELRDRDWVQTLPKPYRDKFNSAESNAERRHLVKEWRQEEKDRWDEWEFVRRNEPKGGGLGLPVFLEDAKTKANFDLFVLNLETQIPAGEAAQLKQKRTAADQDGAWIEYVVLVARLSDRHPLLPGPADGPKYFNELPEDMQKFLTEREPKAFGKKNKQMPDSLARASGRWPDFAIAVTEYYRSKNWMLPVQFGPTRKDDKGMPADVRTFIEKTLEPTLLKMERADRQPAVAVQAKKDRARLHAAEGMWPDYPRTVIDLARQYKLVIPGWMLPERARFRPDPKKGPREGKG